MAGSPDETRVVKQALLDEAAKWSALSTDMTAVQRQVDDLALQVTAFCTDNPVTAQAAKNAYDGVWHLVSKLAGEAATEFRQIDEALRRAHEEYEATDGRKAYDLSRVYGR
ncbi:hypothetical protein ACIBSW_20135 [Actinoplanes sp. NPDC049668]|uniref:hypothetical protein n=1 Tax=unclassified Actinoplanes TaxID=2626549 RepID=UPI00339DC06E